MSPQQDYSLLLSCIVALLTLVSIIFTWVSVTHQIRHNKLSVIPVPYVIVGDYSSLIFVRIKNNGIGPLIIKSISCSHNGKIYSDLVSMMPEIPKGICWNSYTQQFENRSIRPGDEIELISLKVDEGSRFERSFRDKCRHALKEITVTLHYTDVYSQHFKPTSRKLDWFGRENF